MEGGGALTMGVASGRALAGRGDGFCRLLPDVGVGGSVPSPAFPLGRKTGAGSGGRLKQGGWQAGVSSAGAFWRGEGFLCSHLKRNVLSHSRAFSLLAFSLCYKDE